MAVENLELQEQQSDRKELEETLDKLEKHKDKLVQQIKAVRQLCYEESQQVMLLRLDTQHNFIVHPLGGKALHRISSLASIRFSWPWLIAYLIMTHTGDISHYI